MANAPADPHDAHAEAVADAKRLMRLARTGALATLEAAGGGPLTTLVGVASDFDGSPLFLMSTLSRHTGNLARDPRASLLLTGEHHRGDPLNHPRVTLGGRVERLRRRPRQGALSQAQSQGGALCGFCRLRHFPPRRRGRAFQRRVRPRGAADARRRPGLARGRSGAGGSRGAAHRRGQRARRGRARGARGTEADAARLARDRPRRRGPRPRRRRPRRPRVQFRAPAHDPATWRARLGELHAAG